MAPSPALASEELSTRDTALLAEHGIEPTLKHIATYLRRFKPNEALQKRATKLIKQLGDPQFDVRQEAVNGLLELPFTPRELLLKAAAASDPEIAYRAKTILHHPRTEAKLKKERRRRDVAAAVLRLVRQKPIRKATPILIETIPFFDSQQLRAAAADAIAAVAEAGDIPLLRQSIAGPNPALRIAAIRGLGAAAGQSSQAELRLLCRDANPLVALAAAHALAAQMDRFALSVLIKLASSGDENVRVRSVQILRALTKRSFSLNPYGKVAEQETQLERWRNWLAKEGSTAKLHTPLKLSLLPEDLSHGLLAHYNFDQDASGRLLERQRS